MTATRSLAEDYSRIGAAWQAGPGRIYDVMADRMLAEAAGTWTGRVVVDVGAGTGAASRAIRRAGGRPIALDLAAGMLAAVPQREPRVVADARGLALRSHSVDGYVAAFCLNHLTDPGIALTEAVRVVRPGGLIVASAYDQEDHHPVKEAVEAALGELGWELPAWARTVKQDAVPRLATVQGALGVASRAGLRDAHAGVVEVPFPWLQPEDLVAWRLGMAQVARFMSELDGDARRRVATRALELLDPCPPLVRRMVLLRAP